MGINDIEVGEEISAWTVEAGYAFDLAGKETVVAIGFQGSDNYEDVMPEKRYIGSVGMGIFKGTTLALEYFHDDYETEDEADVFTAQLAIEF